MTFRSTCQIITESLMTFTDCKVQTHVSAYILQKTLAQPTAIFTVDYPCTQYIFLEEGFILHSSISCMKGRTVAVPASKTISFKCTVSKGNARPQHCLYSRGLQPGLLVRSTLL